MIVNCPTCKTPIEVNYESEAENETLDAEGGTDGSSVIICPNCGEVKLPEDFNVTKMAANPDEFAQEKLAHFTLIKLLGQGGFGTVWLAEDINLGRQVALKVPVSSDGDIKSLLHEAKTAARLKHPHIVSVFEVGLEEGQVFIASEYIDGMTLRDFMSIGKQVVSRTVELLIPISEALQHAHDHGVIHRDIKPANIILDRHGKPFVADFGLAKKISAEASISSEGQVLGTAKYMSPEQASGKTKETDHRTDVYALGVILFEMLTKHLPFRGNVRAILHQKIFEEAPSPRTLDPSVPKDLETICVKCLERDPDKRYQSAQDVADELKRFQAGEPIQARPISSIEKTWRWCRRRPGVATLMASLFFSLSFGLAGVSFFWIEAVKSADIANGSFYRSQMKLALQYLDIGDPSALKNTLFPFEDGQSLADLRGFEWDYYDKRADLFEQIVSINEPVLDVAISGQGDLFAGYSDSKELIVWDTKTGQVVQTLALPAGKFTALAFSPVSGILATGNSGGWLRLWNPRVSDLPILEVKYGPNIKRVKFSPDGKWIATGGKKGAVRVRDSANLEIVSQIPIGMTGLIDFSFSPDSQNIAIATDNEVVTLWEVETRKRLDRSDNIPLLTCLQYNPDSSSIYIGTFSGGIIEWNVDTRELHRVSSIGLGAVGDIEIFPDLSKCFVSRQTGYFYVYGIEDFVETNRVATHVLSFGTLARSRNGKLIVTGSGDGSIKVLRTENLKLPDVLPQNSHVRQVEFSQDDDEAIAIIGDDQIAFVSLDKPHSKTLPLDIESDKKLTSIAVQPNGNFIAISGTIGEVLLWDRKLRKVTTTLKAGADGTTDVLFSDSGDLLSVASRQGEVWIYDVSDLKTPICTWTYDDKKIGASLFHPNGKEFFIALDEGRIEVRDLTQNGKLIRFINSEKNPRALCYCEFDETIVVGTNSGRLHFWKADDPEKMITVKAHSARINDLQSFPDGKRFASGSRDRLIKVWDVESVGEITSLSGHSSQIFSLDLSPDGNSLLSSGLSGAIRIWRGR